MDHTKEVIDLCKGGYFHSAINQLHHLSNESLVQLLIYVMKFDNLDIIYSILDNYLYLSDHDLKIIRKRMSFKKNEKVTTIIYEKYFEDKRIDTTDDLYVKDYILHNNGDPLNQAIKEGKTNVVDHLIKFNRYDNPSEYIIDEEYIMGMYNFGLFDFKKITCNITNLDLLKKLKHKDKFDLVDFIRHNVSIAMIKYVIDEGINDAELSLYKSIDKDRIDIARLLIDKMDVDKAFSIVMNRNCKELIEILVKRGPNIRKYICDKFPNGVGELLLDNL